MIHTAPTTKHVQSFDLKSRTPPAFIVLRSMFDVSATHIALHIGRSPSQVTYYATGKTPIPADVLDKLLEMVKECVRIAESCELDTLKAETLAGAYAEFSYHVIEKWDKLHKDYT